MHLIQRAKIKRQPYDIVAWLTSKGYVFHDTFIKIGDYKLGRDWCEAWSVHKPAENFMFENYVLLFTADYLYVVAPGKVLISPDSVGEYIDQVLAPKLAQATS
ncbi:hypothetical protein AWM75_08210 [Aerococcus urinaehominis]|uniref:Uncharacterized protein n=1 Tax=Aerococcus urinaehominis TaxID=128944 RepID=A0A109RHC2_9LACT|nr:hypothetical protein [Aerococcus urinaehominis]AMB99954.1 hypothetical protein AWM75_08210 [Aerococcus urinaehominis]SDM44379.1 hypothetical protein SAMN04487985_1172 [Aerococcus urinaehominis]